MHQKDHPFHTLPTELRQQILLLSLPDTEILPTIQLRASRSRDNIWQTNVWEVHWHCGALAPSTNPLKSGEMLAKPGWLERVEQSELFDKDREYVREQWVGRVPVLGEKKVKAWEAVFGRRFVFLSPS